MSGLVCPICSSAGRVAFSQAILDQHLGTYAKCDPCGFLWVHEPAWLAEAYESPIAAVDSGVLSRVRALQPRLITLLRLLRCEPPYVDVGGGHGVLVRSMRDAGFDFRWDDPYSTNVLAPGFEYDGSRVSAAVAVEVIEHVSDPSSFVVDTLARTGADILVLTTEVLPEPVPPPAWWYFTPETGQHISFFERRTLQALGHAAGLFVRSRGNLHVLSRQHVPSWQFLLAATRVAVPASAVLRRGTESLTDADNPLLARRGRA